MFHAVSAHTRRYTLQVRTDTHKVVCIYKKCHCAAFLASWQADDPPSFSSCLGKQRAFCKRVRQKYKQFVVTIVLPANSRDLAVPSKQLAARHKDTFCHPLSSSFIAAGLKMLLQKYRYPTTELNTVIAQTDFLSCLHL